MSVFLYVFLQESESGIPTYAVNFVRFQSVLSKKFFRLLVIQKPSLRVFPVVPDVLNVIVILEHVEHFLHVLDIVLIGELDADSFLLCQDLAIKVKPCIFA